MDGLNVWVSHCAEFPETARRKSAHTADRDALGSRAETESGQRGREIETKINKKKKKSLQLYVASAREWHSP